MKEFAAQTGGRYTYIDDVLNLQNLALAFASIFDECDNFIVKGCKVTGASISDGYVYINGKLRYFPGASNCTWPQYIYEANSTESVAYENGTDKVGRNVYGCAIAKKVPTVNDPLTGSIPQYILISSSGGTQMKDALFGKYSLILNSAYGTQDVNGVVNFTGNINVAGAILSKNRVTVQSGNSVGQMYYDGNNFVVQSKIGTGASYKIVLSNDNGFVFYVDNDILFSANNQLISLKKPVTANSGLFGNVKITNNHIYNDFLSSDNATIYINCLGYNGGSANFRNTNIGNGKGSIILSVNGKSSLVSIYGQLTISGSAFAGLTLQGAYAKTNNSLRKIISWTDSASSQIGYIGYNSTANKVFEIYNDLESISITGSGFVNIGPVIKENGILLSDKYVQKTTIETELKKYVKKDDVFTSTDVNKTFAKLSEGLSQFVAGTITKSSLRAQIDAVSIDDVLKKAPELSKCLSDMASTEELKRKICSNIGATYGGDYQPKMKNSGWVSVRDGLCARQIGNIVYIQGYVTTIHSGVVFTIPNSIDPPSLAVTFSSATSSSTGQWICCINANSRNCTVDYCNNHGVKIPFSLIYMI
jgi:hypothetical protein